MKVKTIKAHLRQVKKRLIKTKDNIQGYEYWTKENKFGVVELEKQCIEIFGDTWIKIKNERGKKIR